jgi:hypothetical protein
MEAHPIWQSRLHSTVTQFVGHYPLERPYQGKGNQLLFPRPASSSSLRPGSIQCHERLGELLKFYQRASCILWPYGNALLVVKDKPTAGARFTFSFLCSFEHTRSSLGYVGFTNVQGLLDE